MDKYPLKKKLMLQIMVITSICAFTWLRHTSPIQINAKSLTVTSCKPDFQISLHGKPDPCLKHKLQTLFTETQTCELICNQYTYKSISFKGESAFIKQDQLFLSMSQDQSICTPNDKCLIHCDDENLNRVLNVPNNEKSQVFLSANFWFILYAWVLGSTACGGVGTFQDAIATKGPSINYVIQNRDSVCSHYFAHFF